MTLSIARSTVAALTALMLVTGCGTTSPPVTPAAELPAPRKTVLVLPGDASQNYEILGEVTAVLDGQGVYNFNASQDLAREHLKRVAYQKYGERLDAIINYRQVAAIGGGSYFGQIASSFGAKNTSIEAKGVAVRYTGRR